MGDYPVAEISSELSKMYRGPVRGYRTWELLIDAQMRFEDSDTFKKVRTLVDTGSRLPLLVRKGLMETKRIAPFPVQLRTANGSPLEGGTEGCWVTMKLPLYTAGVTNYHTFDPVWGFEADIVGDCII